MTFPQGPSHCWGKNKGHLVIPPILVKATWREQGQNNPGTFDNPRAVLVPQYLGGIMEGIPIHRACWAYGQRYLPNGKTRCGTIGFSGGSCGC